MSVAGNYRVSVALNGMPIKEMAAVSPCVTGIDRDRLEMRPN